MKILVIGGTVFVGRHVVESLLAGGHEVTLFNRGKSGPGAFPKLETIIGDRQASLQALKGRRWDAVVDTCGYRPQDVQSSAELLKDQVERYVYISSLAAYAAWGLPDQDEKSPLYDIAPRPQGNSDAFYGRSKAACDLAASKTLKEKALIVRAGVIVGPRDAGGKLAYWAKRMAGSGDVLAPGDPNRRVQILDVRDLAKWIVGAIEGRKNGTFNVCGPGVAMKEILECCRRVSGGTAKAVWVDEAAMLEALPPEHDIRTHPLQFMEQFPFWVPGQDDRFSVAAAKKEKLTYTPLETTVRDTLAWLASAPKAETTGGLPPAREKALLAKGRRAKTARP